MGKFTVLRADPGKAGKAKSTLAGRYTVVTEVLAEAGGDEAEADVAVPYDQLRSAVGEAFASRFGMEASGALKVAGDTIGNSAHGLRLRKQTEDGREVVFVREATVRVGKALAAAREAGTASSTRQLAAVRRALGFESEGE